MPSSISSSEPEYWVRPMAERAPPAVGWVRVMLITLLVIIVGVGAWEATMRAAWLTTADIGDGDSAWARERRKVGAIPNQAVIVGSSRLLFNIDMQLWRKATGIAPLQLSMRGTTPRPMIADLARDPKFNGLLVVGYDPLVFFGADDRAKELVATVDKEPLFRRPGLWMYERLSLWFAYLDPDFRPLAHINRWPVPQRTQRGPFNSPWKLYTVGPNREAAMWERVERDAPFRLRAEQVWLRMRGPPPKPAAVAKMISEVARDAAIIRARGGEVVFVRSPSDQPLIGREDAAYPRARTWDRLIPMSRGVGIYYADEPSLRGFRTVELSHLGRADRAPFTLAVLRLIDRSLSERGERLAGLGSVR